MGVVSIIFLQTIIQVTGYIVSCLHLPKLGNLCLTPVTRLRTPGMEPAACRRIGGAWNLSLQMDALNATLPHLGNGRQQSLRVGMITLLI